MANPENVILGIGLFKYNATLPGADPEDAASYSSTLGNIVEATIHASSDKKERFASISGTLQRDRRFSTLKKLEYEFTLDELSPTLLGLFYKGGGSAINPGVSQTVYGWFACEVENEVVAPLTNKGVIIHHSFKCQLTVEGDIKLDGKEISTVKATVSVDLSTPGTLITTARPITS